MNPIKQVRFLHDSPYGALLQKRGRPSRRGFGRARRDAAVMHRKRNAPRTPRPLEAGFGVHLNLLTYSRHGLDTPCRPPPRLCLGRRERTLSLFCRSAHMIRRLPDGATCMLPPPAGRPPPHCQRLTQKNPMVAAASVTAAAAARARPARPRTKPPAAAHAHGPACLDEWL